MSDKIDDEDMMLGGYVTGVPYREMRLRMLLTGTNAPTDEDWADALGKLLHFLNESPEGKTFIAMIGQ